MGKSKFLLIAISITLVSSSLAGCGGRLNAVTQPTMTTPSLINPGNTGFTTVPQGFGGVSGKLVDTYGRGIPNAIVTVDDAPQITTRTNNGDFMLQNVPSGFHTLRFKVNGRESTATVNVMPNTQAFPDQNPVRFMPNNAGGGTGTGTGIPNNKVGTFKADQGSMLYDWQAKGVSVSGGSIYVSAADTDGLLKAGTVIKMDASSGKNWKDLGSKFLGLSHPISSSVQGITVSGGSILAVDDNYIYSVDSSGNVKKNKSTGGTDISAGSGTVYVAGKGTVGRTDTSGSTFTPLGGVSASGGIGADNSGNLYVVSGNAVKKIGNNSGTYSNSYSTGTYNDPMSYGNTTNYSSTTTNYQTGMGLDPSMAQDIVMGLNGPVDVAIDNRNGDIYVLDGAEVRRFDQNGSILVSFASTAKKGVAIAVDENGNVYVADSGSNSKDSCIIKFSASADGMYGGTTGGYNNNSQNQNMNYNTGYGTNPYDTYGSRSY